ncbi:transglycosylase domain-containing protein [Brevibacterium sp. BRM-1]|uniref:transglycosylase domain-containing protein n=1 Tax=Brevibacterium sp. BRM-1 TaxID=2999062 RepID=UPI00227E0893|nr:transglycosylase domain-containing protein [Brevibacterium sp. BRM-1]WAL39181.1 transglycosylase domain-containing protein [Brevibacterium sp. BRM-1]
MVSSVSDDQPTGVKAWLHFVALSVVAGIVAAGLAIPAMGAASVGAENAVGVFNSLPAELEERPLAQQSKMLASDGSTIATFYWQNRKEVGIDKISQPMQNATVAVEDYRFFEHGGVDLQGIGRAVLHNLVSGNKQGGSTLTQQYVKNVLAENAHAQDDVAGVGAAKESEGTAGYARKLREAKLAVAVEKKYPKKEILNRYMNINNYSGSPNVYGVEAAAQHYWGIPASKINVAQAATLAGIVKNPSAYNPERNEKLTLERRNVVLGLMLQHGKIDQKQYDAAKKTGLGLKIHKTPNGCSDAGIDGYFCDYVQSVIRTDPAFGKSEEERKTLLQRGGLIVKTSLNPKIQKIADKAVKNRVPVGDPSGAGHSAVTVEPGSGKVIAMVQNRKYSVTEGKKNVDTQLNYNVDRAHNGASGFQVGSTWKPFVLAQWLKSDRKLMSTVNASKREFPASSWKYEGCPNMSANWSPNNAGDGEASSSMTALAATKQSVNTAFAAMGNQLNMCDIAGTASDLGVKYGSDHPLDYAFKYKQKDGSTYESRPALGPSSILGAAEVAPIDMASAFATFASGGTYCKPTPIVEITHQENGKKVDIPSADCKRALDKDVAKGVAYALTQTFNGGTTSGLSIGVPAGAKTGTTNFEVGSTWLSGFTKKLATSVWTGDPRGVRDWRKNGKGKVQGRIYGATISGKTWQAIMSKAVKHTKGNTGFAFPSAVYGGGGGGGSSSSSGSYRRSGGGGGGSNNGGGGGGSNNGGGGGGGSNNGGGGGGGDNGGEAGLGG